MSRRLGATGKGRRLAPHVWRAVLDRGPGASTSGGWGGSGADGVSRASRLRVCCALRRLPRARPPHTCILFREVLHFSHQSLQMSACFPEWGLVPLLVTCAPPADVILMVHGLSEEGLEGPPSPQTVCCFPKTRVFVCLRRKLLLVCVAWVFLTPVRWNTSEGAPGALGRHMLALIGTCCLPARMPTSPFPSVLAEASTCPESTGDQGEATGVSRVPG